MRFGIFSDTHLGVVRFRKMLNFQNAYGALNNKVFCEAIDILNEQNLDAVLVAGDLFDSPNPGVQSIVTANNLSRLNVPTYILGGNHCYSQRDAAIGCHPFDLLLGDSIVPIYNEAKIFDFEDCDLTAIPYKFLNADSFKKVYRGKLRDKKKCSILLIHGSVDLNGNSESEEYALPKNIAANYDLVIAGHVHIPQMMKTNSVSILVPGSLMPSAQATGSTPKPSVYIYDTNKKDCQSIPLKYAPRINEIITGNINETLESICNQQNAINDLYFIKYNGKMQDIDDYLYKRASQNTLNLSVQTNETMEAVLVKKVSDFWTFINESYPKYYDEFKNFLKEE